MLDPVTILFVAARPDGTAGLRLDRELKAIKSALTNAALAERFRIIDIQAATFADLTKALLDFDPAVVHFSGHGQADALLLEGPDGRPEPVTIQTLVRLFQERSGQTRLVVFNACDSLGPARAVAPFVDCAVGTTEPVGDRGACVFAQAFYTHLGYGRSVQQALKAGQTAIIHARLEGADDVVLAPRAGVDPSRLCLVNAERGGPLDPKVLESTPIELTVVLARDGSRARVRYLREGRPLDGFDGLVAPADATPGDGAAAFRLLFPNDEARVALMQTVTGSAVRPTPDRYRWRIRIRTTDPFWRGFPWSCTSWEGRPLAASARPWSFELAEEDAPRGVVSLRSPARLLFYAPAGQGVDARRIRAALAARSTAYSEAVCVVAETREAFSEAWRLRPAGVLLLGGDPGLDALVTAHVPTIVYAAGVPLPACAAQLAAVDARPDARTRVETALRWWQHVLVDGADPVGAAVTASGGALSVFTRYDRWEAGDARDLPGHPHPWRRLDREEQRSRVYEQVEKLVENRARQAVAVVATGEPGHQILRLSELLEDHLKRRGRGNFRLERVSVHFPNERAALADVLELRLADALRHRSSGRLADSLDRAGPRRLGQIPRVLWLDWGCLGRSQGLGAPLSLDDLATWLRHCEDVVAAHCPTGLSIFCTIAVETARHDLVTDSVNHYAGAFRERFTCYALPPLKHVTRRELQDYFSDPDNTGIDRGLAGAAVEVLIERTGGDYGDLMQLIEQGNHDGWNLLIHDMGPGPTRPDGGTLL